MSRSNTSALRRAGGLTVAAGVLFAAAGAGAWLAVTKQLRDERIVVPGNAPILALKPVQGPVTAFVQAQVIKQNAERGAGGRTFADISAALRDVDGDSDEARELRKHSTSLAAAAGLRTSLMMSVLAYGVSVLVAGIGTLFVALGSQLRRVHGE